MIFDNYDSAEEVDLNAYIPQQSPADILVTTRQNGSGNLGAAIDLPHLGEGDSTNLLLNLTRTGFPCEAKHVQSAQIIADFLGFLPLGLVLAGAYMLEDKDHDLKRYCSWVESQDEDILRETLSKSPARHYLSAYQYGNFRNLATTNQHAGVKTA